MKEMLKQLVATRVRMSFAPYTFSGEWSVTLHKDQDGVSLEVCRYGMDFETALREAYNEFFGVLRRGSPALEKGGVVQLEAPQKPESEAQF